MIAAFLKTEDGHFDTARFLALLVILFAVGVLTRWLYGRYKEGRLPFGGARGTPLRWVELAKSPKEFWFLFGFYCLLFLALLTIFTLGIFQYPQHR